SGGGRWRENPLGTVACVTQGRSVPGRSHSARGRAGGADGEGAGWAEGGGAGWAAGEGRVGRGGGGRGCGGGLGGRRPAASGGAPPGRGVAADEGASVGLRRRCPWSAVEGAEQRGPGGPTRAGSCSAAALLAGEGVGPGRGPVRCSAAELRPGTRKVRQGS